MDREHPGCPFERYADDVVVHCDTEEQARQLQAALTERLGTLGLELHPAKTKIVYCQDTKRRGEAEHTSFDFLGYTFRGRLVRGRRGFFVSFAPAMSTTAKKAKGRQIRAWHLNRRSGSDLSDLARESTPRCEAGSTTTGPSTAPCCTPWQRASTSTSCDGPCRSSNDCAAGQPERGGGWTPFDGASPPCSRTGTCCHPPHAGLWEPYDGRPSRTVLREREGEAPSRYSPSS